MHLQLDSTRSLRRASAALVTLLALAAGAPRASAQDTPPSTEVQYFYDSGYASNDTGLEQVIISFRVKLDNAAWMRLAFGGAELSGDPDNGTGSILRVTSLYDADTQNLNAVSLGQWRNTSCYLNGDELLVEVVSQPHTGRNRVVLKSVTMGLQGGFDSQCGPTDDRVLSGDGRAARILPIGCTGWLINDCRSCLLTAGHCTGGLGTVQFNVPLSTANGSLVNPPASDQYAVDPVSIQSNGGQGIGNDWGYFGCFPNSNTGLTPFGKQLVRYNLAAPPVFNGSESIRITGYGVDSSPQTSNQVQQTSAGPWVTSSGTLVQYKTDTEGGNSGSPIVHDGNGDAIGIHTHGGCSTNGTGQNSGTMSTHSGLQAALASPKGVCLGTGACSAVGNNFCVPGPLFSVISGTGSSSITANNLVLHANNIPTNKTGIFFYSLNKQNVTFVGSTGRLCVGGGGAPVVRLPAVNSGAGTTFTFNVNYLTVPVTGIITPGSTWHFQAWFRTAGSTETSNGLTILFNP